MLLQQFDPIDLILINIRPYQILTKIKTNLKRYRLIVKLPHDFIELWCLHTIVLKWHTFHIVFELFSFFRAAEIFETFVYFIVEELRLGVDGGELAEFCVATL